MAGTTTLMSVGNLLFFCAGIGVVYNCLSYFWTMIVMVMVNSFRARKSSLAQIDEREENNSYIKYQTYHAINYIFTDREQSIYLAGITNLLSERANGE